jgi:hypothetical protein
MPGYVKPVFFLFLVVTVAGVVGGVMAADRGRRVPLWCLVCAVLPPALLFLYFAKPLCEVEGVFKRCVTCGELIKWHAPVCKYCKSDVT